MTNNIFTTCVISSISTYETIRLSIKNITGPDPAKFTENTEGSGPGLRKLSENDDLSVPECSSGSGSNSYYKVLMGTENNYLLESIKALICFKLR